jgi:hypothetical protein
VFLANSYGSGLCVTTMSSLQPIFAWRDNRSPASNGCQRARLEWTSGGSVRDYAKQLACLTGISLSKNRLKNRFNFVFSNGEVS